MSTSIVEHLRTVVAAPQSPAKHGSSPTEPSLDRDLSSTAPDARSARTELSIPRTIATAAGAGALLGSIALRGRGAGWSAPSLLRGMARGLGAGALAGAVLLGTDRLTGGGVARLVDYASLERIEQIKFVLSNPTRPWLARHGLGVARDARRWQEKLYGQPEPLDGPQDAYRHAFAAALFTLRAVRDHGQSPERARALAIGAGAAHERDGQDGNDEFSRAMDLANNELGASIAGDGRALPGEAVDADGFVTEPALSRRVLDAMARGELHLVDRSTSPPTPRASTTSDLPAP